MSYICEWVVRAAIGYFTMYYGFQALLTFMGLPSS